MARIKKDKDSWQVSGVLHRDARHDKSVPETPRKGKRKNTKKCEKLGVDDEV